MELEKLLEGIEVVGGKFDKQKDIKSVKINSSQVEEGDLFVCMRGVADDGNVHLNEIDCGFVALSETKPKINCEYVLVKNARKAYARLAQNFWLNPLDGMKFVAVVGTNGKTSTAHYIDAILTFAGFKTGLIGTQGHFICGDKVGESLTTPDPMELNELFFKMRTKGVDVIVSEVSAHAIYLEKLDGIVADIAVLTNITEDHLDFFEDYKKYAETKKSFFDKSHTKRCVVNVDDECGRQIIKNCNVPVVTYGLNNPADAFAIDVTPTLDGEKFVGNINDEIYDVKTTLYGEFNVYNLLAAMTVASELGVSRDTLTSAIRRVKAVRGRFTVLKNDKGIIVIDYAHTPDGLKKLLETARPLTKAALVCVFGCGGDRERQKRRIMGEIASRLSDYVVLTSDNPRFEEPQSIMNEIAEGIDRTPHKLIENRAEAIAFALKSMEEGDTVVIAGKGAEEYIDVRGRKLPYCDFDVVRKWSRIK